MTEQVNSLLDDLAVQHIGSKIDVVVNGFTLAWLEKRGLTQDFFETLDKEAESLFDVDRLTSIYLTMGKQTLERRLADAKEEESAS